MTQLLHLVIMFTPSANLVTDEFYYAKATNSIAKGMISIANRTKSKRMNSIEDMHNINLLIST